MSTEIIDEVLAENKKNIKFASFSFLGTALNYGSKFLLFIWLAKHIGFSSLGVISLVMSIVLLVEKLFNPQIWLYLIKEKSERIDFETLNTKCFFYELLFKFFATIFFYVFIFIFFNDSKSLYLLYGLYIPFSLIGTALGLIRINNDYYTVFLSNLTVFLTNSIVFVILFSFNIKSIFIITLCILIVDLSYFLYLIIKSRVYRTFIKSININIFNFKELKLIFFFHINGALRVLNRELDVVIVSIFFSSYIVGIYKLTKQIVHLPLFLTDGLYNAIYPSLCSFYNNDKIDSFKILLKKNVLLGGCVAFFSIFLVLILSYVLENFYYDNSDGLFLSSIILICPIVLAVVFFPLAPAINAMGETKLLIVINLVSIIVYFALMLSFSYMNEYYLMLLSYLAYYVIWTVLCLNLIRIKIK